ncbi:MAG TPA: CheR family methyltransferase, partial [Kofleriaceae bacterium]|nr:CheR family methyltransferase [Kofleriaceae bacterium]
MSGADARALEALEMDLLIEALFRRYGYDFRHYSRPSLARRIRDTVRKEAVPTISALQDRMLHDPGCADRVVTGLTVHTTSMVRDPEFYQAFRGQVVPLLRTYPFVRIWHAGCSTGEEVYSLAILLHELGIYDRCRIYATDVGTAHLER